MSRRYRLQLRVYTTQECTFYLRNSTRPPAHANTPHTPAHTRTHANSPTEKCSLLASHQSCAVHAVPITRSTTPPMHAPSPQCHPSAHRAASSSTWLQLNEGIETGKFLLGCKSCPTFHRLKRRGAADICYRKLGSITSIRSLTYDTFFESAQSNEDTNNFSSTILFTLIYVWKIQYVSTLTYLLTKVDLLL